MALTTMWLAGTALVGALLTKYKYEELEEARDMRDERMVDKLTADGVPREDAEAFVSKLRADEEERDEY